MKTSIQIIRLLLFLSVGVFIVAVASIISSYEILQQRLWGLALTAVGSIFTFFALLIRLKEMNKDKKKQ
ncbi:MAG: hypothetical protein MUF12_01270 [Sediminibacterium sp.]|nr:hypothetical protein [Sediminibacterium sp.]